MSYATTPIQFTKSIISRLNVDNRTENKWTEIIDQIKIDPKNSDQSFKEATSRLDEAVSAMQYSVPIFELEKELGINPNRPAEIQAMIDNLKMSSSSPNMESSALKYAETLRGDLNKKIILDSNQKAGQELINSLQTEYGSIKSEWKKAIDECTSQYTDASKRLDEIKFAIGLSETIIKSEEAISSHESRPPLINKMINDLHFSQTSAADVKSYLKKLQIIQLEGQAGLTSPVRPAEVAKLFEQKEANLKAVEHYINGLKTLIKNNSNSIEQVKFSEDYGIDEPLTALEEGIYFTPIDAAELANISEKQPFNQGSFGIAESVPVTQFSPADGSETKITTTEYIQKRDIKLNDYTNEELDKLSNNELENIIQNLSIKYTENEYAQFKEFWSLLSEEERQFFVPLIGQRGEPTISSPNAPMMYYFMEKFEGDLNNVYDKIPLNNKIKIADSIICSLDVITSHGYILGDIKGNNMLYRGDQAVLCDYGGLVNFEKIIENPTLDKIQALHDNTSTTTPDVVPFNEHYNFQFELENIIKNFNSYTPEQLKIELQKLKEPFIQFSQFCTAVALYEMLTNELPYPLITLADDIDTLNPSDVNPLLHESFRQGLEEKLLEKGCTPELANRLSFMLHPDISSRPTGDELHEYALAVRDNN